MADDIEPHDYPRTLKCVGAIVYYAGAQPMSYMLIIKDVQEPVPDPSRGTEWKRVSFFEAYKSFDSIRSYWNPDGTAMAWEHLRPWQIHLSTALFLSLLLGAFGMVDFALWRPWFRSYLNLESEVAIAVVLLIEIGLTLAAVTGIERRIRRRESKATMNAILSKGLQEPKPAELN